MAKKTEKTPKSSKPQRVELTREETIKRMKEFPLRKDKLIAAIRKVKD